MTPAAWKEQRSLRWPLMLGAAALAGLIVTAGALLADQGHDVTLSALRQESRRSAAADADLAGSHDARRTAKRIGGCAGVVVTKAAALAESIRAHALERSEDPGRALMSAVDHKLVIEETSDGSGIILVGVDQNVFAVSSSPDMNAALRLADELIRMAPHLQEALGSGEDVARVSVQLPGRGVLVAPAPTTRSEAGWGVHWGSAAEGQPADTLRRPLAGATGWITGAHHGLPGSIARAEHLAVASEPGGPIEARLDVAPSALERCLLRTPAARGGGNALLVAADGRVIAASAPALADLAAGTDDPGVARAEAAAAIAQLLAAQSGADEDAAPAELPEGASLAAVAAVAETPWRTFVVTPQSAIENVAAVRFAKTSEAIHNESLSWMRVNVFFGILVTAFGIGVAVALRRRFRHLLDGAAAHAAGNFDHRVPILGGDEFGALGLSLNATAVRFKQIIRRQQEGERRLRGLIENMGDGFVMLDSHDNVTSTNQRFVELVRRPKENVLSKPLDALLEHECAERFRADAERRRQSRPCEYEFSWRVKGTAPRTLLSTAPLYDEDGRWIGTYAVVTDITVRARAQRELAQAEKLQALGEMAGGVAHDFNNVLTVILGNAQFLLMDEHDEHVTKALSVIERAALDGTETVRRIREFSKTRAVDMNAERLDPNELVDELAQMVSPRISEAREAGVEFQLDVRGEATRMLRGNGPELREALLNVVFNALDAMPEGGRLILESFDRGEDTVGVRIEDTGSGMDAQTRKKIFDPFFTTKDKSGRSSGLGLSITFGIIRAHGGRVDVRSEAGEGSTFTVVLPALHVRAGAPAEDGPRKSGERFIPPDPRVLMLGPAGKRVDGLHQTLNDFGMFCAAMPTAASALAIMTDEQLFNVFVVEHDLGAQNGWELARQCRSLRDDMRIILIAEHGRGLNETQAKHAGIDRILFRPFDARDLYDMVLRLLAIPSTVQVPEPLAAAKPSGKRKPKLPLAEKLIDVSAIDAELDREDEDAGGEVLTVEMSDEAVVIAQSLLEQIRPTATDATTAKEDDEDDEDDGIVFESTTGETD